ncbi:MAG TPA: response regulator [Bacteroidales bacterium]|nr:response regulator [Bacteroidales bacterium]
MEQSGIIDLLLVEDNQSDAELIIRALKKQSLNNTCKIVSDGAEALDFLFCKGDYSYRNIDHQPRVVFLDLKLPKISGLEVLGALRCEPKTANIPVVALTSSQEEADIRTAYNLGVNSYVVKPLDFESLSKAISQAGTYWLHLNHVPFR